jgi:hypothetical protein
VDGLPPTSPNRFTVSWGGTDGHSGIDNYDVYVAADGGGYALWQAGTAANSATFTGTLGTAYAFYSVATDAAGNREQPPAAADAHTVVTATEPEIRATHISNRTVYILVDGLMPGWSNVVERSWDLRSNGWHVVDRFVPTSTVEPHFLTVTGAWENLFYRLRAHEPSP